MIKTDCLRLILFYYILVTVRCRVGGTNSGDNASELNLFRHLLKNYDKEMKPSSSVEIRFALNLNQIVTLIEREQILVVNVFLDHEWIDKRLKWNPSEFNNITLLRINSEKLWA